MPDFTKDVAKNSKELYGYDPSRGLQVLQIGKETEVTLVDGADCEVKVVNVAPNAGPAIVEVREVRAGKGPALGRKLILKAKALGSAYLQAQPGNARLAITVVRDSYNRLFDGSNTVPADPQVVKNLKLHGLREAALRVAEDQMNSGMGKGGKGANYYLRGTNPKTGKPWDWCGGFAEGCYETAARVLGVTNPFAIPPVQGNQVRWALASPQRAIKWVKQHPGLGELIRHGPIWGKHDGPQLGDMVRDALGIEHEAPWQDLVFDGNGEPTNLMPEDICLERHPSDPKDDWKHVALVYDVWPGWFETIDGNQGNPSIKIVNRKYHDVVRKGKYYRYTFVHLKNLPTRGGTNCLIAKGREIAFGLETWGNFFCK
jgi:hypothetical protein